MKKLVLILCATLASSVALAQTCNTDQPAVHIDGQYIDRLDGTILDVSNSLLWSKCNVGEIYNLANNTCSGSPTNFVTWQSALNAVSNAGITTIGDKTGFRMPNIKELTSIVDYRCAAPAINLEFFNSTINTPYWSNTPDYHGINPGSGYEGLLIDYIDGQEVDSGFSGLVTLRLVKEFN